MTYKVIAITEQGRTVTIASGLTLESANTEAALCRRADRSMTDYRIEEA